MEKIRLKPWQKWLMIGLFMVMIGLIVIQYFQGFSSNDMTLKVKTEMNINLWPSDSTGRLFYEGVSKGDSVCFEQISGADEGWIFQLFMAGREVDYRVDFDLRQSGHVWKKGDTLLFVEELPEITPKSPLGIMRVRINSFLKMAENSVFTDRVECSKYFVRLICTRYDSIASFKGSYFAEENLLNPDVSDDVIVVTGGFVADSIHVGRRLVN